MSPELRDRAVMVALLLAAWAGLAYSKAYVPALVLADVNNIIAYVQVLLGGIVGYHVGTGAAVPAPAVPAAPVASGQAGRSLWAYPMLLAVLAFVAACSMGCTTTTASMYSGLYTQAKAGVMVFDDNAIKTARDLLCAQPYSAIQRNAELQAGVVALCGPMANVSSLDANQLALLMQLLGKAGVGVTAVPVAK